MAEVIAFDTHRFVKNLTARGFTEPQAEAKECYPNQAFTLWITLSKIESKQDDTIKRFSGRGAVGNKATVISLLTTVWTMVLADNGEQL